MRQGERGEACRAVWCWALQLLPALQLDDLVVFLLADQAILLIRPREMPTSKSPRLQGGQWKWVEMLAVMPSDTRGERESRKHGASKVSARRFRNVP
jgi:hypothetical protein